MILDLSGYYSPIENIDNINMYSPIQQLWDPTIIGWETIGWERIVKFAVYMYILDGVWGGFGQQDRLNYRSLLQKSPIQERIFCTRDL